MTQQREQNRFEKVKHTYIEALRMDAEVCRLERKVNDTTDEIRECRKLLNEGYNIYRLFE